MSKKTKRITVGLVSALCLMLVVAIGFGVTGAWYRARREATGTIKLDQGIILTLTNLDKTSADPDEAIANGVVGELHELNDTKDGMIELATSTEPGDVKYVVVPTIAAADGSTSFYAKAKLVYTFNVYNSDRTGFATIGGEGVDKDNVKEYTLADLYTNAEHTTAATLDNIFANQITFNENWVKIDEKDYYVYSSTKSATAPTAIAYAAAATPVDIFAKTADITGNTSGKEALQVSLKDWTDTTNPAEYVEFGGPNFYDVNGNKLELAQINVRLVIEVIQEANTGVATDAESALAKWLAE